MSTRLFGVQLYNDVLGVNIRLISACVYLNWHVSKTRFIAPDEKLPRNTHLYSHNLGFSKD